MYKMVSSWLVVVLLVLRCGCGGIVADGALAGDAAARTWRVVADRRPHRLSALLFVDFEGTVLFLHGVKSWGLLCYLRSVSGHGGGGYGADGSGVAVSFIFSGDWIGRAIYLLLCKGKEISFWVGGEAGNSGVFVRSSIVWSAAVDSLPDFRSVWAGLVRRWRSDVGISFPWRRCCGGDGSGVWDCGPLAPSPHWRQFGTCRRWASKVSVGWRASYGNDRCWPCLLGCSSSLFSRNLRDWWRHYSVNPLLLRGSGGLCYASMCNLEDVQRLSEAYTENGIGVRGWSCLACDFLCLEWQPTNDGGDMHSDARKKAHDLIVIFLYCCAFRHFCRLAVPWFP